MKTYKVIDTIYEIDEGQDCFVGTLQECIDFVEEQDTIGLHISPMNEQEILIHNS